MSTALTETDTTEDAAAESAARSGTGRHRGPAAGDRDAPSGDPGHGRHRRPTQNPAAST